MMTMSDLVVESRRLRGSLAQIAQELLTVQQAILDKARDMTREQMKVGLGENDPSGVVYLRYANAGGRAAAMVVQALGRLVLLDRMVADEQVQQEKLDRDLRAREELKKKEHRAAQRVQLLKTGHLHAPVSDPLADLFGALAHARVLLLL